MHGQKRVLRTDSFRRRDSPRAVARGDAALTLTTLACTSLTWASPSW
jgi:hypothetical protein